MYTKVFTFFDLLKRIAKSVRFTFLLSVRGKEFKNNITSPIVDILHSQLPEFYTLSGEWHIYNIIISQLLCQCLFSLWMHFLFFCACKVFQILAYFFLNLLISFACIYMCVYTCMCVYVCICVYVCALSAS